MKEGPDIARLASLIADPARANMLIALLSGKALTASELANEAGVTVQTASSHLKKLETDDLLQVRKQGRHRYFTLADSDIGALLENMMGMAAKRGLQRTNTGPRDAALRDARICYDHLAGHLAVSLYTGLLDQGALQDHPERPVLTPHGHKLMQDFGIAEDLLGSTKGRPVCRACLDWSERRSHLAGRLGAAVLDRIFDLGWAKLEDNSRIIRFAPGGVDAFKTRFGL